MRAIHIGTLEPPSSGVAPTHQYGLSRRAFLGSAAGATAAAALWRPTAALGKPSGSAAPKPTTNVVSLNGVDFHFTFFGAGMDPSVITDFNGFAGVAQVQGTGTGTNPDGSTETLLFDTDMRFMSGTYVGEDDKLHHGAFAFV